MSQSRIILPDRLSGKEIRFRKIEALQQQTIQHLMMLDNLLCDCLTSITFLVKQLPPSEDEIVNTKAKEITDGIAKFLFQRAELLKQAQGHKVELVDGNGGEDAST